jgi:hypothetical protein
MSNETTTPTPAALVAALETVQARYALPLEFRERDAKKGHHAAVFDADGYWQFNVADRLCEPVVRDLVHAVNALPDALTHVQQVTRERDAAESKLRRDGYRKSCDIPACNCGESWSHGGHAHARLSEIGTALADVEWKGTILATVEAVLADVARLEGEKAALVAAATQRLARGCNDTCSNALGEQYPCDCGQRALAELLTNGGAPPATEE